MSSSDAIWWPDEPWWERKVLPLGFVTLSLRQLVTMMVAFLAASLISLPFGFPIAGISFGGRAVVLCFVFGVGYIISNRRVRLLPVELQALYFLRRNGVQRVRASLGSPGSNEDRKDPSPGDAHSSTVQEMVVEDFRNPVPMVVSGRLNDVEKESRALLFLDDLVRGEDSVSPQKPRFRLIYVPRPEDLGKHHLTVRIEGSSGLLVSVDLTLQGRGTEFDKSNVKAGGT